MPASENEPSKAAVGLVESDVAVANVLLLRFSMMNGARAFDQKALDVAGWHSGLPGWSVKAGADGQGVVPGL